MKRSPVTGSLTLASSGFTWLGRPLQRGDSVVGLDVVNAYASTPRSRSRAPRATGLAAQTGAGYHSVRADLADTAAVQRCFAHHRFDRVMHLAAQAGVRYSLEIRGLRRQQRGWLPEHPRRLPAARRAAPGLCLELRVYGGNTALAVSASMQRGSAAAACTRPPSGQRADGAHLQPPVRPADHRPALLHRSGPGAGPTWRCSWLPARSSKASRSVFNHGPCARLHLRRRHREGWCAPATRPPVRPGARGDEPRAATQQSTTACSTSATATRCSSSNTSARSRKRSEPKPRSTCCPRNLATCPTPMPT